MVPAVPLVAWNVFNPLLNLTVLINLVFGEFGHYDFESNNCTLQSFLVLNTSSSLLLCVLHVIPVEDLWGISLDPPTPLLFWLQPLCSTVWLVHSVMGDCRFLRNVLHGIDLSSQNESRSYYTCASWISRYSLVPYCGALAITMTI